MLTSDLNLSKNCKRIEILKCVLKNVHYYYYYYYYYKITLLVISPKFRYLPNIKDMFIRMVKFYP